ncbi:type ISP restriction/modification enzyme [Rhodococcus gordoniae]|uniref:type ISP restriction/modification enzyme n=1 Tax=Rhodococcus gordoniae TaxID=223392 RepID=UPI003526442B
MSCTSYRGAVGGQVRKDDVFYYVYGPLRAPVYCENYAADWEKMLPHIPNPKTRDRFEQSQPSAVASQTCT